MSNTGQVIAVRSHDVRGAGSGSLAAYPNAVVITDGIAEVRSASIVTDIYATAFHIGDAFDAMDIRGVGGESMVQYVDPRSAATLSRLTPREREVLAELATGFRIAPWRNGWCCRSGRWKSTSIRFSPSSASAGGRLAIAKRRHVIECRVDGLLRYPAAFGEVLALALAGDFAAAEKRPAGLVSISSAGQYLAWSMAKLLVGTVDLPAGDSPKPSHGRSRPLQL